MRFRDSVITSCRARSRSGLIHELSLRTDAELPDAFGAKKIDVQELTPVTYAQLEAKKAKTVEETRQPADEEDDFDDET
jgi:hypothetical protein